MVRTALLKIKNLIIWLYHQFSDLLHIAVTFVLCYFCFLLSPTLTIAGYRRRDYCCNHVFIKPICFALAFL